MNRLMSGLEITGQKKDTGDPGELFKDLGKGRNGSFFLPVKETVDTGMGTDKGKREGNDL